MSPRPTCPAPAAFAVTFALLLGGCESRPRAPLLRDSPVYRNAAEGIRFLVPEGWIQTASSSLPEGTLKDDSFLVRYRINTPEPGATLQIECTPDRPEVDLLQHHSAPSYRVEKWASVQPPEELQIGGSPAQRLVYSAEVERRRLTKEVVCFRRHGRIYSFVGLFWSSDDKAREQVRRAVASTIWDR